MDMEDACRRDVINRLRRIQGQVAGIVTMIEDGRECSDIVVQVAAVSRAVDRAGFKIISAQLQACESARAAGQEPEMSSEQLERLFMSLA